MKYILIVFYLIIFIGYVQAQCDPNAAGTNNNGCQCNQGFYGQDATSNGICIQCPVGSTTKTGQTQGDVSQCSICLNNYYMTQAAASADKANSAPASAATCTACPTGSGNLSGPISPGDISQCDYCLENYFMTQNAYGPSNLANNQFASAAQCSPCPANSLAPYSNKPSVCICFDKNALQLTTSNIQCTCKRGMQGKVSSSKDAPTGCSQCPPGYFSMNSLPCTQCGAGSYISDDQGSCTCFDTSNGTNPWNFAKNVCQCQFNFYGDPSKARKNTSGSCSPCPDGTSSPNGSLFPNQCTLNSSEDSKQNQQGTISSIILHFTLSLSSLLIFL
ncbi:hypothetical protein ABPG72_021260 [Tetrahymena utriculariae]